VLGIAFIMAVYINVSRGEPPFTYTLMLAGISTLVSGLGDEIQAVGFWWSIVSCVVADKRLCLA